jgi:dTDP-glucose 4,6-dehydratase
MTKRVLLTGASGFVGSHILKEILENTDWEVVCLSTFRHSGTQDRILYALDRNESYKSRVTVLVCDLSSPISKVTSKKILPIDYVINSASESHVDRSIKDPSGFILTNVSIVCNMLDWARENPVEKFLHISTDEIYGPYQGRSSIEWDPHLPSNPYSASKAAQEDIAFAYWRTYDIPLAVTNTMNMFGEAQNSEKFTPLVIKKILAEEELIVHTWGNGQIGERFWLHARAQGSAIVHLLKTQEFKLIKDVPRYERWNIPGDVKYSNLGWAEKMAEVIGKPLKYRFEDGGVARPGYDSSYVLDTSKLADTGWKSPTDIDNALSNTVRWYLENQQWL